MFDGLVTSRERCQDCEAVRQVAYIAPGKDLQPFAVALGYDPVKLCASCIYKLQRLAGLLLRLEGGAGRKRPQKPARARAPRRREAFPTPVPTPSEPAAWENRSTMP